MSTMRGGSAAAAVLPVAGMQQARGSALRFFGEGQTRDRDTPAGRPVGHAGGPWAGPTENDSAGGAEGLGDTPAALLEEMASGIDEMCGVQQVIKTTFTALHDVIKAQGLAIKALERDMKAKASVAEVDGALQQKANISDVNSSLQDVCVALEKKANTWDLDSKLDRSEMHDMMQVKAAADGAAAELSGSYSAQNVDVLRSQLERAVSRLDTIPPMKPKNPVASLPAAASFLTHHHFFPNTSCHLRDVVQRSLQCPLARNQRPLRGPCTNSKDYCSCLAASSQTWTN